MGDNLRSSSRKVEDLPKNVYISPLGIRKNKIMSLNNSSNKSKLIIYPSIGKRSPSNRPNSLPTSGKEIDVSGLWNLTRSSFCCRITQLPQLQSLLRAYLYN